MHRSSNHPSRAWLAPVLGVLAIAAFPGAAFAAAPVNTTAPSITIPTGGAPTEITNPSEGRTLTSTPGTWNPAQTTYSYQWTQDCTLPVGATPGTPGTAIAGATNATYKIAHGDIGHKLCLTVSAGGSAAVISSNETGLVTAGTPIDRSAPTMSGVLQDGQTLTASPGTWDGTAPITFTYAWRRCGSTGTGCGAVFTGQSTSDTYTLTDADLGHTMSVVVTATNPATTPTTMTPATALGSFATNGVVTPGNTGMPTISGTAQVGQTLTESHGSWVPSSPTFGYQWESCDATGSGCSPITGATSQTYPVTSADAGHTLVVQETASQAGASSSASSAPTGVVPQPVSANTGGSQGGSQNGSQNGSQPAAPTGGSTAPAAVTVAQLRGLLDNALAVHGGGARISALVKHGGYSFTFAAPSAGTLAISWYRRLHGRTILIAKVSVRFHKTGKAKLELVLTSKGRNLLKGAGRMTLAAQGGFTPVGHSTTSASTTITLKK
jgi:hypothetical protein